MRRSEVVLPDYANEETDERDIQKVGLRNVWLKRKWSGDEVVTKQSVYVSLSRKKGIHMSRLAEVLEEWEGEEIEIDNEFLDVIEKTHGECDVYWKCEWNDIFKAERRFMVKLQLEGRKIRGDGYRWYLTFVVPYASVCPCSAAMCKSVGEGVPHMQRSEVKVTVEVEKEMELQWLLTDMILDVVDVVKLVPSMVLTREEELEWCKKAEKVNLFVEDVVRKVADVVDRWEWIKDWVVCAEHEESIHQHNVVAIVWKGRELR